LAEANGFDSLLSPDHPGAFPSPHIALAAAAAVTKTIRLGSCVLNAGVREPALLASEVATLDMISGGRAVLGLGTGHQPAEWAAVGRVRPEARGRVDRFFAVAEATRRLLNGEEVTVDSPELTMTAAKLVSPRPVQDRVPLRAGGSGPRMLRWAAENADIVGLSGVGRRWEPSALDEQLAPLSGKVIEAQVHKFEVTDNPEPALRELATRTGLGIDELRQVPYVLVGTAAEIASAIRDHERRWGITRYEVYIEALADLPSVRAALASL
jgi:probable F420-dependent oxidoreductase